jgi:hypothetical protein
MLKVEDARRLQAFEFRCWRRMLNIDPLDRVTNVDIHRRVSSPPLCADEIRRRRLTYLGHVLRRPEAYPARRALLMDPSPHWKRPRGGTRLSWRKTVLKDISATKPQHVYPRWDSLWREIIASIDRPQWNSWVDRMVAEAGAAASRR